MRNDIFKLSTLAALVLASTSANAAIYRVVEVDSYENLIPDSVRINNPQYQGTYGSAIAEDTAVIAPNTCFTAGQDCTDGSNSVLAGEAIKGPKGYNYRQEAPFGIDNGFVYDTLAELETYCNNEFKFATCSNWATRTWSGITDKSVGGLERELNAWGSGYPSNASAFVETGLPLVITPAESSVYPVGDRTADSVNTVINSMDVANPVGNSSSGIYNKSSNERIYRNRGFYGDKIQLLPRQVAEGATNIVAKMGRTTAYDSFVYDNGGGDQTYIVGSAAVAPYDTSERTAKNTCIAHATPYKLSECQDFAFAMKPYIWQVNPAVGIATYVKGKPVSPWTGIGDAAGADTQANSNSNKLSGMGSVKGAVKADGGIYDGLPVLVGYNTENVSGYPKMQAAVFIPKIPFDITRDNEWETKFVTNATYNVGGSAVHSNSIAKDINDDLIVIGEAKRLGSVPENGSANNRLFVADASTGAPVANFLTGGIFFSGAGGEANAINNDSIIVGQIDAETSREVDGKKRRRRGFVYPYSSAPVAIKSIFNDKAWWIDDLTNGGVYSSNNNKYRIINASDINEAGVIAATAIKCTTSLTSDVAVEYESTAHNAYCGADASGIEKIVSVKLVPLITAEHSIEPRSTAKPKVTRKGAGFGLLTLTALALISFRRRK
ncbi:hypothetical protein MACH09_14260 [Vibrio sp. MACH09]|uniref:DUF3466 family protein n=1 Tax=Vibrio sp. MACH09 TaxID=3025122 RepID=UPI0027925D10|nr:DUF3466 family protein [Vibrio sp. MACH09]GLO60918.1 hypothetical protein MACH09_14260 [Vibrio sp. MACH09]